MSRAGAKWRPPSAAPARSCKKAKRLARANQRPLVARPTRRLQAHFRRPQSVPWGGRASCDPWAGRGDELKSGIKSRKCHVRRRRSARTSGRPEGRAKFVEKCHSLGPLPARCPQLAPTCSLRRTRVGSNLAAIHFDQISFRLNLSPTGQVLVVCANQTRAGELIVFIPPDRLAVSLLVGPVDGLRR